MGTWLEKASKSRILGGVGERVGGMHSRSADSQVVGTALNVFQGTGEPASFKDRAGNNRGGSKGAKSVLSIR